MLPFKKILCPTDFSDYSYEALKTASDLALHFDAELCVVHVVPPVPMVPTETAPKAFDVPLYQQALEVSSKQTLEEVVNRLESGELRSRLIVVQGDPAYQIIKITEEEKPDLIVLANHGRTGWERAIFGSVAEKVIRLASCPVLTIRRKPPEKSDKGDDIVSAGEKDLGTTASEKRDYQEKIETQVKEWAAKIDALKSKAEKTRAEAQTLYLQQLETLRVKLEEARHKLKDLKESGGGAWGELKTGIDKALKELKEAFGRAKTKFKEK